MKKDFDIYDLNDKFKKNILPLLENYHNFEMVAKNTSQMYCSDDEFIFCKCFFEWWEIDLLSCSVIYDTITKELEKTFWDLYFNDFQMILEDWCLIIKI